MTTVEIHRLGAGGYIGRGVRYRRSASGRCIGELERAQGCFVLGCERDAGRGRRSPRARRNGCRSSCYLASSGADIVEGVSALHGWGSAARAIAACSGTVPVIFAVTGPAVSGPALLLGLADHVVMTDDAYAFVSGPVMVAEFTGVPIDNDELGGGDAHARHSGAASVLVSSADQLAEEAVEQLLAYLPPNVDELPPVRATDDDPARATPEAGELMPVTATGSYDVRARHASHCRRR